MNQNKTVSQEIKALRHPFLRELFRENGFNLAMTLVSGLIIGVTTYIICFVGLKLGVKFGTKLSGNAKIVGGLILIGIGIEIFIKGMLGV